MRQEKLVEFKLSEIICFSRFIKIFYIFLMLFLHIVHHLNQTIQVIPACGKRNHQEKLVSVARSIFALRTDENQKRTHHQHMYEIHPQRGRSILVFNQGLVPVIYGYDGTKNPETCIDLVSHRGTLNAYIQEERNHCEQMEQTQNQMSVHLE